MNDYILIPDGVSAQSAFFRTIDLPPGANITDILTADSSRSGRFRIIPPDNGIVDPSRGAANSRDTYNFIRQQPTNDDPAAEARRLEAEAAYTAALAAMRQAAIARLATRDVTRPMDWPPVDNDTVTVEQIYDANYNDGAMYRALMQTPLGPMSGRVYFDVVVFRGRLFLSGGKYGTDYTYSGGHVPIIFADVLSSTDGKNWTAVAGSGVDDYAGSIFAERFAHSLVVHNGRLFMIGGLGHGIETKTIRTISEYFTATISELTNVWSTSDGRHWVKETDALPFCPVNAFTTSLNGRIICIDRWGKVMSSSDGRGWVRHSDAPLPNGFLNAEYRPCYTSFTVHNNVIYATRNGDYDEELRSTADKPGIVITSDAYNWTPQTVNIIGFPYDYWYNFFYEWRVPFLSVGDKMYLIGSNGGSRQNLLWSINGTDWYFELGSYPGWDTRYYPVRTLLYNNHLYALSGLNTLDEPTSRQWMSKNLYAWFPACTTPSSYRNDLPWKLTLAYIQSLYNGFPIDWTGLLNALTIEFALGTPDWTSVRSAAASYVTDVADSDLFFYNLQKTYIFYAACSYDLVGLDGRSVITGKPGPLPDTNFYVLNTGSVGIDGWLSRSEKSDVIRAVKSITDDRIDIDAWASGYPVTSRLAKYDDACDSLLSFLESLVPAWDDITSDTAIVNYRTIFAVRFDAVYGARTELIAELSALSDADPGWRPSPFVMYGCLSEETFIRGAIEVVGAVLEALGPPEEIELDGAVVRHLSAKKGLRRGGVIRHTGKHIIPLVG